MSNCNNSNNNNGSNSSNNCSPNNSSNNNGKAVDKAKSTTNSPTTTRKQTGTVPKMSTNNATTAATKSTTKRIAASISQQPQQQRQVRKNTEIVAPIRRELKDLNDYLLSTVVSATTNNSQTQQQQPISSTLFNSTQQPLKLQSSNNSKNFNKQQLTHQQQQQLQQQQQQPFQQQFTPSVINDNHNNYEFENIQENQRFCYPVRPIPRRTQQLQQQQQYQLANDNATNNLNTNSLNHAATIGVVIPTTPTTTPAIATGVLTNINEQQQQHQLQQQLILRVLQLQKIIDEPLRQTIQQQQQQQNLLHNNIIDLAANIPPTTTTTATVNDFNNFDLPTLLQLLSSKNLVNNNNNSNHNLTAAIATATTTQPTTATTLPLNITRTTNRMVHEINASPKGNDVVMNSASLEDVALSEISDRAQSIQSLHSAIETPTPDNTPSYDELQHRLEASNRNIQNMQDQQHQLLRLQNAAKQHLNEMEKLRQQAGNLSFSNSAPNGHASQNGGDMPEYESIDQVHSDMSSLVGRMKNLTTFIQHQNELSNLMGDDGPEILAEQQELQRKLESLREQRDEMRSLVHELQDVNRSAERSARNERAAENKAAQPTAAPSEQTVSTAAERVVPVEYRRVVPIELLQPSSKIQQNVSTAASEQASDETAAAEAATAALIQQKVSDIEAMKSQLKRLKEMMETVNLIEAHTARPDPKVIGRTPPPRESTRSPSTASSFDRERTPVAAIGQDNEDPYISRKVRMINQVTSDLRAQAESLQAERDRIKALKDEIVRRKEQAAAAAQLGENALKRHSLTPTPTPFTQRQLENDDKQMEREQLKSEYEAKKKEFDMLCQRLQNEEPDNVNTQSSIRSSTRQDVVSEADDEADEELNDLNDSDFAAAARSTKFYAANVQRSSTAQSNVGNASNSTAPATTTQANDPAHQRSAKDSLDSTITSSNAATNGAHSANGAHTHDEAGSVKSCSSHSYSMPPAMPAMGTNNWPGPVVPPPLPTAWNPHFYYGGAAHVPPQAPTTAPPSSSDCICSAANSGATLGAATNAASSTTSAAAQLAADPVLLQQFVQTQQMLINSVCQCNQMLWHQQREIDALNNTIHVLQDRLLTLSGGPNTADLSFNLRSESVPPAALASGALSNNMYASLNRAQSEQPQLFLPAAGVFGTRSAFTNYHQQQQQQQLQQQQQHHLFQQRQRGLISTSANAAGGSTAGGIDYNYSSETQQQQNIAASTNIFTTLNNAGVAQQQPPPPPTTAAAAQQAPHFNNETPQSPLSGGAGGPGPIFMHHHNNAIHQNNANLRTQNHYANNLQHQQQQHNNIANNSNNNTLNNQVPPGNRANNYWDNFRSYSRQNLLSTNSNKSNEEQQQQQHPQQQHDEQYQPQRPALTNLHHHHQQQQQQQQQQQHLYQQHELNNASNCNNLNYDSNICGNSKYLRALQRSRINQHQQQQQQQQQQQRQQYQATLNNMLHTNLSSNIYQPTTRDFQQNLNWHPRDDVAGMLYGNYNIIDGDMPAAFAATTTTTATTPSNLRNMNNINFGNSPHYQRNKVPAKLSSTTLSHHNRSSSQQQRLTHLRNIEHEDNAYNSLAAQQPQQQQHYRNATRFTIGNLPNTATLPNNVAVTPQNQQSRDYLLRTVDIAGDNYGFGTNAALTVENIAEFEDEDEDDDTTSEEIKRNLLVNALKNDKFTTKFYESIKEDVFRRLESMLLEKESSDRERACEQQQQQQQQQQMQHVNDVSDPLRKLYLNARIGNQQQQQQQAQEEAQPQEVEQQCYIQPMQQLELELEDLVDNNNADTESNNADNEASAMLVEEETLAENETATVENDKAEEDESEQDVNAFVEHEIAEQVATAANWRQNIASNTQRKQNESSSYGNVKQTTKKRKNQRRHEDSNDAQAGACSLAAQQQQQQQQQEQAEKSLQTKGEKMQTQPHVTNSVCKKQQQQQSTTNAMPCQPDYELINYIITRIRNQTHANTHINDTVLVEIAKLTATAAQNAATAKLAAATSATAAAAIAKVPIPANISPKKIYAKMKKLTLPRQRDEFLVWFQRYLETLFLRSDDNAMPQVGVTACKQQKPTTQQHNNNLQQLNDGDLAEADQNCSANTSSNAEHEDDAAVMLHVNIVDNMPSLDVTVSRHEIVEFENNENPDEEAAGAIAAVATTTIAAIVVPLPIAELQLVEEYQEVEEHELDDQEKEAPVVLFADSNGLDFVQRNGVA